MQEPIEIVIDSPTLLFNFTSYDKWDFNEDEYIKNRLSQIRETINNIFEEIVIILINV